MAVKTPMTICKVVAQMVHTKVQVKTAMKASRKVERLKMFQKFSIPTQSKSLAGGVCLKS